MLALLAMLYLGVGVALVAAAIHQKHDQVRANAAALCAARGLVHTIAVLAGAAALSVLLGPASHLYELLADLNRSGRPAVRRA